MVQYNTIEEAISAVIQENGVQLLRDINKFVALLSDYAPNLVEEQKDVRAFARAGGFQMVLERNPQQKPLESFVVACQTISRLFDDSKRQNVMLSIVKSLLINIFNISLNTIDAEKYYSEGMKFYRRHPREENMPVALLLLSEAARLGNTDSLFYISNAYLKGKGVPKNSKKGISALEQAADKGSARAGIALAKCFNEGDIVEKDTLRAKEILQSINDPIAQFELAEILNQEGESEKATEYYLRAAEKGNVYAQYAVAIAYATGRGILRDLGEGKKWLRMAAAQGHSEARRKLEELGEL